MDEVSNVAHVNCGNCRTTLMYPYGAPSVKCAVCHYITNVNVSIPESLFIFQICHSFFLMPNLLILRKARVLGIQLPVVKGVSPCLWALSFVVPIECFGDDMFLSSLFICSFQGLHID